MNEKIEEILRNTFVPCIAPFYYRNGKNDEFGNGTIFFINTGKKLIGITAYHVYKYFLNLREDKKVDEVFIGIHSDIMPFSLKDRFMHIPVNLTAHNGVI